MNAATFAAAVIRLAVAVGAAGAAGRWIASALGYRADALGRLATAVVALAVALVSAEALGLIGALRSGPLIVLLLVVAVAAWWLTGRHRTRPEHIAGPERSTSRWLMGAVAVALVGGQWLLASADALGGGMYNFDTLWYHMPFAAGFAQSGSITAIQFTQADPWVAYYPANSELLHAVGLVLMHGDLLSTLVNLGWLAVLLLGAWCFGRPWGREPETLVAGCLVAGLPVLASTQPGEAFNDIAGIAMLVAAAALWVNASATGPGAVAAIGLALGFALGVKLTFVVPVVILALGVMVSAGARQRAVLVGTVLLTGGFWYARNLVAVGNPLGARLTVGPIVLPGPRSPLSAPWQETVLSQLRHTSLWGSRFIPGLTHMFGVLWPALAIGAAAAVTVAIAQRGERSPTSSVRALAIASAAAALTYIVLPTGAAGIGAGTVLFEVNLRYLVPAVALAALIIPVLPRSPRAAQWCAAAMLIVLGASQLQHSLWPAAPLRHAAFLIGAGALTAAAVAAARIRVGHHLRLASVPLLAGGAVLVLCVLGGGAYAVQHHYLQRRYRVGGGADPSLHALFAWAQTVSGRRVALYGTVEQYPLYGALVTNRVDYLGARTGDGGYRPIASCAAWRAAVDRDRAQYVVMTPGPTGTEPLRWTQADPAARLVLAPGPFAAVYALSGPLDPRSCRGSG